RNAIHWAKRGDWGMLIYQLEKTGDPITPEMRKFIAEALAGKRKRPNNRAQAFIAWTNRGYRGVSVYALMEDGIGKEAAIDRVVEKLSSDPRAVQRKVSAGRRTIQRNLKEFEDHIPRQIARIERYQRLVADFEGSPRYEIDDTALSAHF